VEAFGRPAAPAAEQAVSLPDLRPVLKKRDFAAGLGEAPAEGYPDWQTAPVFLREPVSAPEEAAPPELTQTVMRAGYFLPEWEAVFLSRGFFWL